MKHTILIILALFLIIGCNKIELEPQCENITIEKIIEKEIIKEVIVEKIVYVNQTRTIDCNNTYETVYIHNKTCDIPFINTTMNIYLVREIKRCEARANETWDMVVCKDDLEECEQTLENIREEID